MVTEWKRCIEKSVIERERSTENLSGDNRNRTGKIVRRNQIKVPHPILECSFGFFVQVVFPRAVQVPGVLRQVALLTHADTHIVCHIL